MKILFVQDSLGTGGAERSNAEFWYFLRDKQIDFKILVLEKREVGIQKEILREGFDVQFLKKGSFFFQSYLIGRLISDYKPTIVHSVLFRSTFRVRTAKLFGNFYNIESLVNCSYDEVRYNDPRVNSFILKCYEFLDRWTSRKLTNHFVAITQEVKSHHLQHLRIKASDKVTVISRGRKENSFLENQEKVRKETCEKFKLDEKDLIYVHVGRQEYQKGHLVLLNAIKYADDQLVDSNVNFIFCGREGNATPDIENFRRENSIKTNIKFVGNRSDIYEILASSNVFVFPSLYEGLGGSLIEAQAAGLPIICSDIPVFHEVVINENALFFESNNHQELGDKLVELANSPHKRNLMGANSLSHFIQNFKLEEINEQMWNLYQNLAPQ